MNWAFEHPDVMHKTIITEKSMVFFISILFG